MNDDVIPLNEIGKIETVKVYNQSYVNKQQKRIDELEEKISILLSCKNCPDNKGGLLCQKEYEDKCLSQKIQYIKELKEEIAELEKEKSELCNAINEGGKACVKLNGQLTYAKTIIQDLLDNTDEYARQKAEDFFEGE